MDEAIQVSCIIDKLPSSWKYFQRTLKHQKEKLTLVELGSHLHIEESLKVQDNDKPNGNNVAGPSVVNMMEHNNSSRYIDYRGKYKHQNTKSNPNKKSKVTCWKCEKPGHLKRDCKGGKVGYKSNGSGTMDEALDKFKVFKTEAELQQGSLIKRFKTDRGGEYMDTLYFQSVGIIHEMIAPHTPQQNGISEKKNKVLKEMVNSILSYSGLSQGFWGKAMLTTCYLLYRVPYKRNKITLYELWTRRKPNLNYLRVWGCKAVVRFPDPKLKSLGERGIECIFVGYVEHSKAFRFYVIEPNDSVLINSIIQSMDAIFDENRFFLVPRPSLRIPNGNEDIGGLVVPEEVTQEDDPKTFDEAMKSQNYCFWKEAINNEMEFIMGNNTWVLADLPPGCKPLGCKWIFKRKLKIDGTIQKFMARPVIQCFRQKLGIDYFDTYAPVARISTIRLLIAMTSIHNLVIYQMDVKTSFLNGELDGEVYMNQTQGFIMPGNKNKVDMRNEFLSPRFSMKDMGEADVIMGIRIKHKSKSHYIKKVLEKFNYFDCTPVSTPMVTSEKLMS
ncbi:zinc finger, CCHC-type containing protein [Tanacetum coccineum]|uniref:Zinc finger, CCHC-type containing protein n=1 Tax=Tanacetum coccineum TaxID=301880 RepID=A0ABQ5J5W0_9ASTR